MERLTTPACSGLCHPCSGYPEQDNPLIYMGLFRVFRVFRAAPRTRRRVQAGAQACAPGHAITRARPPRHTHHTRHKMSKNNDLDCSGYPEQPQKPGTAPQSGPSGAQNSPDTETLAAFSRRLGVNRSTITRAAQAGRLVLTADGRVHIAPSLALWQATRGARDDVAARHAAARAALFPPVAPATSTATPPAAPQIGPTSPDHPAADTQAPPTGSRAFYEAEKLRWQNAQLLLGLGLASGRLIPRTALQHEAHGLGATLRATVERLIDQTSPRLAAAPAAADRRRLLVAEIAAARRLLKRESATALRRLRPDTLGPAALSLSAAIGPDAPQEPTP